MKNVNNETSLLDCFKAIYAEDASKDFKLSVGDECVMVHKLILTNRCFYFKQMLEHESSEDQVIIEDFGLPVVKAFVEYLYTDEINDMQELAEDLTTLADKYGMIYLKLKIEKYLIGKVNVDTAVDYLIFSDNCSCKGLKAKALLTIRDQIRTIKKSEDFNKLDQYPHLYKSIIDIMVPDDNNFGAYPSPSTVFSSPKRQCSFTPPLPAPSIFQSLPATQSINLSSPFVFKTMKGE